MYMGERGVQIGKDSEKDSFLFEEGLEEGEEH